MRILLVSHFFLPRHHAGVELYTYHLGKELQRRHDVHLFFAERNLHLQPHSTRSGAYESLPFIEITNNFDHDDFEQSYANARTDAAFAAVLDQLRPDVIHFQHLLNLSIGMIDEARARRIPALMTLHDYWAMCPSGGWRFRDGETLCEEIDFETCSGCYQRSVFTASPLERVVFRSARRFGARGARCTYAILRAVQLLMPRAARRAQSAGRGAAPSIARQLALRAQRVREALTQLDLLIAPSDFARNTHVAFGIPANQIQVSRYGIVRPDAKPYTPSPIFRIGFIGTIAPAKGVHVLVDACCRLTIKPYQATLCGDTTIWPEYVRKLRASARHHPITFTGRIEHARVAEVLASLDSLVYPSIWYENAPLAVQEALALGVPVVASRIGGLPELVQDGVNGVLFQPGDSAELAAKLEGLRRDSTALARMRNARTQVKSIEENALELEQIYESLVEARANA